MIEKLISDEAISQVNLLTAQVKLLTESLKKASALIDEINSKTINIDHNNG